MCPEEWQVHFEAGLTMCESTLTDLHESYILTLYTGSYKGQKLYQDAILPFLDEQHATQLKNGIVKEEDRTSRYPY